MSAIDVDSRTLCELLITDISSLSLGMGHFSLLLTYCTRYAGVVGSSEESQLCGKSWRGGNVRVKDD